MSWSDNRRVSTDIGWYMPYFTTAEYGWQVRQPIHDMLIRIVDNTTDEYTPDYRATIHYIAEQMTFPDRKVDGKDGRYVSTVKKYLVEAFHKLDIARSQSQYVGPGEDPYPFDEDCETEIISIWAAIDPTIVRENTYKAFMKLAYGDWINYDKIHTGVDSPKTVVCISFTKVTVHGTENGLGTMVTGKNYLQPRLEAIPNGAAGTWLAYADTYVNAINGFTVNSGNATLLLFQIRHTDDSAIQPSHVGDIMMVEGSTIPTAYDADTTMYKKSIMQGNIMNHNFTQSRVAGETQELYQGDDGGGGTVEYYNASTAVPIRCKTYSIPVEQNTNYSIRVFNSSYNDIEFYTCYYSAPGTITPTVSSMTPNAKKSIPGNSTFVEADEQWLRLVASHSRTNATEWWVNTYALPVDVRPLTYEYCDHYATLKAGSYKVMIDAWTNNVSNGWVGFNSYTGCVYDNANYTGQQGNEWFALLEEDNTTILQKQDILPNVSSRGKRIDDGPPYPNYFHNEVSFTIDHDCKVGLFHRAHYHTASTDDPAYFRFMIVDSTVEAVEFTTTGVYGAQQTGYSAWEKYQMVVSVNVKFTDVVAGTSTTLTKTVPSLLYSNDYVDFTQDLPTYYSDDSYGIVTVEVLDKDQEDPTIVPTIDISYH